MIRAFRNFTGEAYRAYNKFVAIRANVTVGPRFIVGPHSYIRAPDDMQIGYDVHIGRNFFLACNGSIGNGVLISSYVAIVGRYDHDMTVRGEYISQAPWIYSSDARERDERDAIEIGDDVWIGYGCIILSGVKIGRGAVIGAGSSVIKDVSPYTIVAGNPAKVRGARFNAAEINEHEMLLARRRAGRQRES
jgi:acetyltransferase-like isoleucine patch superfamily enzyme